MAAATATALPGVVYKASIPATFFTTALTTYGSTYALGVSYERAPTVLRYQKPVFFRDYCYCRWDDFFVPSMFISGMCATNMVDVARLPGELALVLFPASRLYGGINAIALYFAGSVAANLAWKLQSNINPDKNRTPHCRNLGAAGGICALAGSILAGPRVAMGTGVPASAVAAAVVADNFWNEYGHRLTGTEDMVRDEDGSAVPALRQWGGALGGTMIGGILSLYLLRRHTGKFMVGKFYENINRGSARAARKR
eukprot:Hpha_TRINITY_DN32542_c0_g1::TRINITY_DN32542_c0_g1_i1::g.24474::m.24474